MAATIVQAGKKGLSASSSSLTVTFSTDSTVGTAGTATSGNLLLVFWVSDNTQNTLVATGTGGGSFTSKVSSAGFEDSAGWDKTADGTETGFTATIASATGQVVYWYEVSGLNGLDVTGTSTTGGANQPAGSLTPTVSDFVAWAVGNDASSTYDSTSVGTFDGSIASTQSGGTQVSMGVGHILSQSTTISPTVHNAAIPANCSGVVIAYKIAAGGGSTPPKRPLIVNRAAIIRSSNF